MQNTTRAGQRRAAEHRHTESVAERRRTDKNKVMQSDAENNDIKRYRALQSSGAEVRCADEGHNEIESDAGIAAEQHSANDQSNRHQGREMRRGKRRRARQVDAEHDESRAMQASRAEQQSVDDQATESDAERHT